MKQAVGLQADYEVHHMDHLGVVCAIMGVPVLFSDEESLEIARRYYPMIDARLVQWRSLAPDTLVENYDTLFYTNFCCQQTYRELFVPYEKKWNKKMRTVCCPHGNSDKGHSSHYMELFAQEDITLVYGKRMLDFLKEKNVNLHHPIICGNYRQLFYQQHKSFFDSCVQTEVLSRFADPSRPILLYAPTWEDGENGTAFFDITHALIKGNTRYNIIIKCHPRIERRSLARLLHVMYAYEKRQDVVILPHYPHVYPLLEIADLYLGEMSSVGYDYLHYDRPLFFLNQQNWDVATKPGLHLWRCGQTLPATEFAHIWPWLEKGLEEEQKFSEQRRFLYRQAFGDTPPLALLKQQIKEALVS